MNYELHPPLMVKSCCRCGNEFRTSDRERVCWKCRKPKETSRQPRRKDLTFREKQIVGLVSQGKANKEIAHMLLLREGTIKEYLNRIFRKVEVTNRTELAIWELNRRASAPVPAPYANSPIFEKRSLVV